MISFRSIEVYPYPAEIKVEAQQDRRIHTHLDKGGIGCRLEKGGVVEAGTATFSTAKEGLDQHSGGEKEKGCHRYGP